MNPYKELPKKSFWKHAVAQKSMYDIDDLWDPKFNIKPHHKVATFGSCFAQHIGKSLAKRGFTWLITEKAPKSVIKEQLEQFNYNVFTCRTANIYTTSLLKQWTYWANNEQTPPDEIWELDGRFYDPFRPKIEPKGFSSPEEVSFLRQVTINAFRQSIVESDFFVFTLGLTESWFNKNGYEYPMCPGTVAGKYSEEIHDFKNQQFDEILKNLSEAIRIMRSINPKIRFILTVSPVPLTATKSDNHVLVATMQSKSILRAVAGQLASNRPYIDYFPSYEIINSPVFKGSFFEPNQRSVNPYGVNFVMNSFFNSLTKKYGAFDNKKHNVSPPQNITPTDQHCEEALLEVFAK